MVLNLPLNQQKSTSSILGSSTVETTPLFDVFFRGYIEQSEKQAIGQFLRLSLHWLTNDRDTKREKITSVCFRLLWPEKI